MKCKSGASERPSSHENQNCWYGRKQLAREHGSEQHRVPLPTTRLKELHRTRPMTMLPRYGHEGRPPLVRNCASGSYNAGLWNNYCSSNGDAYFLLEGLCIPSQRSTRRLRLMTSLLSLILSVLVVADH